MSNYVDILVSVAVSGRGPHKRYEPLEWAKKNCPSYITNDAVQKQGVYYYRYYFGNQRDQIMFTLRWV